MQRAEKRRQSRDQRRNAYQGAVHALGRRQARRYFTTAGMLARQRDKEAQASYD